MKETTITSGNSIRRTLIDSDSTYIAALGVIVFLILLFLEMKEPFFFLWDDNSNMLLPYYSYNYRALFQQKEIALINFHQFCGVNHIGEGLTGVLYLPAYFGVLISKILFKSEFYAIDVLAVIHLVFSSALFFLLMRKLSVSRAVSFICALAWITFPFVIFVPKSWLLVGFSTGFIPLCFLALIRCMEKPGISSALILALCRTFFVYTGYFQYVHMQILLEILFVLLMTWKKKGSLQFLGWYLFSVVGSAFMSAPQLLPSVKATRLSFWRSEGLDMNYAAAFALPVKDFILAQLFIFKEKVFCLASSQIYYTGVFIYLVFFFIRKRFLRADNTCYTSVFIILAVISFLFSTSLYSLFLKIVPGLIFFKGQFKYFLFFQFFLVLSSGLAADAVLRAGNKISRVTVISLLVLTVISNCYILTHHGQITFGNYRVSSLSPDYLSIFDKKPPGRLLTCWMTDVPAEEQYRYLNWNYATLTDLYHFRGYPMPLISRLNVKYCIDISNYEKRLDQKQLVYLSFWGVRYLITTDTAAHRKELDSFPQLKICATAPGILVCENTKALPLVWYKDQKSHKITFEMNINRITIHPDRPEGGDIVVSIVPLEGYHYYFDGKRAGRLAEDVMPVILSLPPGVKKVELRYSDESFTAGIIILLSFPVILAVFLSIRSAMKPGSTACKERRCDLPAENP